MRGSHGGGGSLTDLPVVFSRDAKYFFVCSCTAVRVFVCDTAQLLTTLQHEQTVTGCAVNPTNAFQVWAPFRVLFPPLSCGLPSIPAASHTCCTAARVQPGRVRGRLHPKKDLRPTNHMCGSALTRAVPYHTQLLTTSVDGIVRAWEYQEAVLLREVNVGLPIISATLAAGGLSPSLWCAGLCWWWDVFSAVLVQRRACVVPPPPPRPRRPVAPSLTPPPPPPLAPPGPVQPVVREQVSAARWQRRERQRGVAVLARPPEPTEDGRSVSWARAWRAGRRGRGQPRQPLGGLGA